MKIEMPMEEICSRCLMEDSAHRINEITRNSDESMNQKYSQEGSDGQFIVMSTYGTPTIY